ncbi:MAG: hypothetical protein JWO36_4697 [Myxococcales bacterium]|nr:hypothetical protein [Myxococcales bacterium]
MEELSYDVRDHRGRLIRFAIAVVLGALVTLFAMIEIRSVAAAPNSDPISGSSVVLLAVGLFVVASGLALALVTGVARRLANRR